MSAIIFYIQFKVSQAKRVFFVNESSNFENALFSTKKSVSKQEIVVVIQDVHLPLAILIIK